METNRYTYRVEWSEEDEAFVARCLELPSLAGHGESATRALEEVQRAVDAAVEWMREEGEWVPEPMQLSSYRGNILFRTTPETHRELSLRAQESGVSLNQYLSGVVLRGLGLRPMGNDLHELELSVARILKQIERLEQATAKQWPALPSRLASEETTDTSNVVDFPGDFGRISSVGPDSEAVEVQG